MSAEEKVKQAGLIIDLVMRKMDWPQPKAHQWFYSLNPNFGGSSPRTLVQRGHGQKVIEFLEVSKAGK